MTMRKRFGVTTAITAILLSGAAYAAGEPMIQSETKAPFGADLADGSGRSVYLFTADKGSVSNCYGACAAAWPPVLASGNEAAGPGVTAGTLGTTPRRDGTRQLTYDGRPLYYFAGDQAAGSTAGQDIHHFGGEWYLVSPRVARSRRRPRRNRLELVARRSVGRRGLQPSNGPTVSRSSARFGGRERRWSPSSPAPAPLTNSKAVRRDGVRIAAGSDHSTGTPLCSASRSGSTSMLVMGQK